MNAIPFPVPLDPLAAFRASLRARGRSEATIRAYGRACDEFARHVEPRAVLEARRADVLAWFAFDRARLAPETCAGRLSAVRELFAWAVDSGLAAENPAAPGAALEIRRKDRAESERWKGIRSRSMDQILASVENASADRSTPKKMASSLRDRALVHVLRDSGMRAAELAALRADEKTIDADAAGLISLSYIGKGGKPRESLLGASASAALREYLNARPLLFRGPCDLKKMAPLAGPLFLTDRGTAYYGPKAVWRAVARIVASAEVTERIHPHSFRHWRGDDVAERTNGNLGLVQEVLGHSDPATSRIYTSRNRAALRRRLEAAGALC